MKITLVTVGTPKLSFAKEGIKEYTKRLSRFADFTILHLKENKNTEKKILAECTGGHVILLDETGKQYSSVDFSKYIAGIQQTGITKIVFLIGGPDGHTQAVRSAADTSVALSKLTLPHDMAMLFFTETLYRSLSILSGHPYHRL